MSLTINVKPGAEATLASSQTVQAAVRHLSLARGFKRSGWSKPASESLVGAVVEGRSPAINAGVVCATS